MQVNAGVARQRQGMSYKWTVACVVILGAFMSVLDQTVVNIAIPRLQSAFGADIHSVQWVATAYLLTQGAFTPIAPFLANTFGIKRTYILSLIAFTAGSLLCGFAWSLPALILFRILQGLGGAVLLPLSFTLLFREFPPEERGIVIGSLGVPILIAPALGPIVGGYLVTYASWQVIFFINIPIGIVAVILAALFLREARAANPDRLDIVGLLTAAFGLAAVLYAFSQSSTDGWGAVNVLGFLVAGCLSLIVFVFTEFNLVRHEQKPLLDLRLLANRSYSAGLIALILVTFSMFGLQFLLPIYLQVLRGLSAFQAGITLLPLALAAMVSVVIGGRLVDRIGPRIVVIAGLILLAVGNWLFATSLSLNSPYGWFQVSLVVFGLALGLAGQPLFVAAMAEIRDPQQVADGTTLLTVARAVFGSMGIAILSTLVQTQTLVHFAHLSEQVTTSSQLGQLLPRIAGLFQLKGASSNAATGAALQLIAGYVKQQSYLLAMRDAFFLTLILTFVAIVATIFVRGVRRVQGPTAQANAEDAAEPAPALVVG